MPRSSFLSVFIAIIQIVHGKLYDTATIRDQWLLNVSRGISTSSYPPFNDTERKTFEAKAEAWTNHALSRSTGGHFQWGQYEPFYSLYIFSSSLTKQQQHTDSYLKLCTSLSI